MKKKFYAFLFLSLLASCVSVWEGYFAKEPDFFLYPNQSILFTVKTGDLQQDALFEKKLSDFFKDKGYSESYSLIEKDPYKQVSESENLSDYLKEQDILYVVSVCLSDSETYHAYIPQNTRTNVYNYGGYISANSYTTGGYYISTTVKTFSITVSDSNKNRFALFEIKVAKESEEIFQKIAQKIYENLTSQLP